MLKFLFIALFLCSPLYAYQNELALKGGVGISVNTVQGKNNTEDTFVGYGFNSHFGYRLTKWEFNISSHVFFGKAKGIEFEANNTTIVGNGVLRTVSFGPLIKYITDFTPAKNWHFYVNFGPTWSIKTVKIEEYRTSGGTFKDNYKLTYISRGGIFAFGIEEILNYKQEHPVYLEFMYGYFRAHDVSLVDASDNTSVQILATESAGNDIEDHIFMVNFGMTIF
ncbi:MAG: hypothetical protein ACO20H_08090 [Bacteriovoracaceae bacterium]